MPLLCLRRGIFTAEGILTEKKLTKLKDELQRIIDFDADGIRIYSTESSQNILKEEIGVVEEHSCII